MTQATTWSVPLVGPATPTLMAQRTDDSFDALLSSHSGSARPSYAVAGTVWQDTSVAGTVKNYFFDGSDDILLWTVSTSTNVVTFPASNQTFGQCQLALSGGNLVLSRKNGRLLTINGAHYEIPSSGPILAASGLTPSTLYYIYAYMNSGTMTLEASTTVPVADTATGVQIKTGDASRSLVGMARPITGPAWADTIGQRFVRSWYNRDKPRGAAVFTADRSANTSMAELNTEIRCEFLTWADENIQANFSAWGNTSSGGPAVLKIVLDANAADIARCGTGLSSSANMSISGAVTPGLGYHFATIYGQTTAGSMTIFGTGTAPGLLNTTIV